MKLVVEMDVVVHALCTSITIRLYGIRSFVIISLYFLCSISQVSSGNEVFEIKCINFVFDFLPFRSIKVYGFQVIFLCVGAENKQIAPFQPCSSQLGRKVIEVIVILV